MNYERGLQALRFQLPQDAQRDFLNFEAQLLDILDDEKRHGSTNDTRRVRNHIVDQLNQLAERHLDISFNDLCRVSDKSTDVDHTQVHRARSQLPPKASETQVKTTAAGAAIAPVGDGQPGASPAGQDSAAPESAARRRRFGWPALAASVLLALLGVLIVVVFRHMSGPSGDAGATAIPAIGATALSIPVGSQEKLPEVVFQTPSDGAQVAYKSRFQGTARNIPQERQLWLLIQSYVSDRYYPLAGPIAVSQDRWETEGFVGRNRLELHEPYTLTAVLADQAASQQLSDFLAALTRSPEQAGVLLPSGVEVQSHIRVFRASPSVSLTSHKDGARVQGVETLSGTYVDLDPGVWRLYGAVEAVDGRFVPYGPFEPRTKDGSWSIDVAFPWPAAGRRELSFYPLVVLAGSTADELLRSAAGNPLNSTDLNADHLSIFGYGTPQRTRLVRTERVAFASDRAGNDDVYVVNADGSGLQRLTRDPLDEADPAWSPDGRQIAFVARDSEAWQLYVMDADGRNRRRVITGRTVAARDPAWSPDGAWIAFDSEQDGSTSIYKVRVNGMDLMRLTSAEEDTNPVWSPAGTILFRSNRATDDAGRAELYVMDAEQGDRGQLIRLTHNQDYEGYAVWSADGTRILFSSDNGTSSNIYLMNADGSSLTQVADIDYDRSPSLAPDGKHIVFDSSVNRTQLFVGELGGERPNQIKTGLAISRSPVWSPLPNDQRILFIGLTDGDWDIYTMWDDGSDVQRMAKTSSSERYPRLSPDGHTLVFVSDIDGHDHLYIEDAKTFSQWKQLTRGEWDAGQPAWSPDGRRIAFASNQDGNWEIYVMNADGTGLVRLTDDPEEDGFPSWSPDGTRIAFYSRRTGDGDIYVMDADGQNVTRIVDSPESDTMPSWSRGDTIAFASARDTNSSYATEIYTMDLSSRVVRRLTNADGPDNQPLWSGDSRHIYFRSDRYYGLTDVWVMDALGEEQRNMTPDSRSDRLG